MNVFGKKLNLTDSPLKKSVLIVLSVCLFLEIFVFNFSCGHILSGKYEKKELDLSSSISSNFDFNSRQNVSAGYTCFEFKELNMPIGTICFDVESNISPSVRVDIDFTDDTNTAYYRTGLASAEIIKGNKRTRTAVCNFSGNVHDLRLYISSSEGEYITVNSIVLNSPVPFKFSLVRFLLFFLAGMAVYFLGASPTFKKDYNDCRRTVSRVSWAFTAVMVIASLVVLNGTRYQNPNHSIMDDLKSNWGNQISQELVDAFEEGSAELQFKADSSILDLENPYDWSQRETFGANYMWDHLLYEGKYYSYYGIAPVLTLFLPYHVLTGYYFPTTWAVWLYSAGGIIFLTAMYLAFSKRFFGNVRSSLVLCGLAMIQFVSGIFFCLTGPNFYEIAQASGFFFLTGGAFFLITSNVIGEGKIRNHRICLSAVFLSLAVLCRPTLAVYCVAALLFIAAGFMKNKKNKVKNLPYLICSMTPFVVIGLVQMIYNFVRFGSPFDFGIQYSLTINDFTAAEYHTKFVLIGFISYFFTMPTFNSTFPFIHAGYVDQLFPQGYYFAATGAVMGLLYKALPILSYGKAVKAYKGSRHPQKRLYAVLTAAVCVICPFIIVFSIWESGYGTRYCVDFAWQIVIGALVIAFAVYNRCSEDMKRHLNRVMIFSTFASLAFSFAQVYSYVSPIENWARDWQPAILSFRRLFEFWR